MLLILYKINNYNIRFLTWCFSIATNKTKKNGVIDTIIDNDIKGKISKLCKTRKKTLYKLHPKNQHFLRTTKNSQVRGNKIVEEAQRFEYIHRHSRAQSPQI